MKEANNRFEKWSEVINSTKLQAASTIAEIRAAKEELMQLKAELKAYSQEVHYLRNDRRLVLSAPEIIIGNVDRDGVLLGETAGTVVIRGTTINLEATAGNTQLTGTITSRASNIRQIAEDPGVDGTEHVVTEMAEVATLAKSIALRTEDAEEVYSVGAVAPMDGISILSENNLVMEAVKPCTTKKNRMEALKKEQQTISDNCAKLMSTYKSDISELSKEIAALTNMDSLSDDIDTLRSNYTDLEEAYEMFEMYSEQLGMTMKAYQSAMFLKAEADRQIACMEKQMKELDSEAKKFEEQTTEAFLHIASEHISIQSQDGDGNLRTNPEAAIELVAPHVTLTAEGEDGALMEGSDISMSALTVNVSTANPKVSDDKTELPAEGDVRIVSKNITMEAVDYTKENDEEKETALTKEGSISLRAEKMDFAATDTEGKATGSITANALKTSVKAMDVDKGNGKDQSLSTSGKVTFAAEDIALGAKGDKGKGKHLQAYADEVGIFAEKTLELQQDSGKAIVQLAGGNTSVGGTKVETFGETTIQGKTTFKSPVTGTSVEMNSMKVKSAFQSPYTTEGTVVAGAASSAKLSAKLELEASEKE